MTCRKIAVMIVTALSLFASACAVQPPGVTAKDVELKSLTLSKLNLVVDLDLSNPNTFALPLENMSWALDIAKKPLADGTVAINEEIAPQGSARIDVPLSVSYTRAASTISDVLQGRSIPYQISGDLGFMTPVGALSVPFETAGRWANPLRGGLDVVPAVRISANLPRISIP